MTVPAGSIRGQLDEFLRREEAAGRFSGTVAIGREDGSISAAAYGFAHAGFRVPNEIDTLLNTASITKMFTTVAVLQLAEEGCFALEDTVAHLLPDVDVGMARAITVDHLLSHRSGLGDYWNARCRERRSTLRTTDDYLALIEGDQPAFRPGTATGYGNTGHVLLAAIVERTSCCDYYERVETEVCRRAGMRTASHLELDQISAFAHGYTCVEWEGPPHPDRRTDNIFQYPVRGSGATGLYASSPELIGFFAALRAGDLVSRRSVEMMLAEPEHGGRGYGTQRVPYSCGTAIGHGGRAFGAATTLLHLPEVDRTVCILANYDRPADKLAFAEIHRLLGPGADGGPADPPPGQ